MNRQALGRLVSVAVGAAVLFGLQQGLEVKFYFALPAAIVAYTVVKVAIGLAFDTDRA